MTDPLSSALVTMSRIREYLEQHFDTLGDPGSLTFGVEVEERLAVVSSNFLSSRPHIEVSFRVLDNLQPKKSLFRWIATTTFEQNLRRWARRSTRTAVVSKCSSSAACSTWTMELCCSYSRAWPGRLRTWRHVQAPLRLKPRLTVRSRGVGVGHRSAGRGLVSGLPRGATALALAFLKRGPEVVRVADRDPQALAAAARRCEWDTRYPRPRLAQYPAQAYEDTACRASHAP
jgi:hypothetical protein